MVQCSACGWTAAAAERHFSPAAFPERSSPSPAGAAPAAKGACVRDHLKLYIKAERERGCGGGGRGRWAGGGKVCGLSVLSECKQHSKGHQPIPCGCMIRMPSVGLHAHTLEHMQRLSMWHKQTQGRLFGPQHLSVATHHSIVI